MPSHHKIKKTHADKINHRSRKVSKSHPTMDKTGASENNSVVKKRKLSYLTSKLPNGTMQYKCTVCGETFSTEANMASHKEKHVLQESGSVASAHSGNLTNSPMSQSQQDGAGPDVMAVNQEFNIGLDQPTLHLHLCRDCKQAFVSKELLVEHRSTCHQEAPMFICEMCDLPFKQKELCNVHKSITHFGLHVKCPSCQETFGDEALFTSHWEGSHTPNSLQSKPANPSEQSNHESHGKVPSQNTSQHAESLNASLTTDSMPQASDIIVISEDSDDDTESSVNNTNCNEKMSSDNMTTLFEGFSSLTCGKCKERFLQKEDLNKHILEFHFSQNVFKSRLSTKAFAEKVKCEKVQSADENSQEGNNNVHLESENLSSDAHREIGSGSQDESVRCIRIQATVENVHTISLRSENVVHPSQLRHYPCVQGQVESCTAVNCTREMYPNIECQNENGGYNHSEPANSFGVQSVSLNSQNTIGELMYNVKESNQLESNSIESSQGYQGQIHSGTQNSNDISQSGACQQKGSSTLHNYPDINQIPNESWVGVQVKVEKDDDLTQQSENRSEMTSGAGNVPNVQYGSPQPGQRVIGQMVYSNVVVKSENEIENSTDSLGGNYDRNDSTNRCEVGNGSAELGPERTVARRQLVDPAEQGQSGNLTTVLTDRVGNHENPHNTTSVQLKPFDIVLERLETLVPPGSTLRKQHAAASSTSVSEVDQVNYSRNRSKPKKGQAIPHRHRVQNSVQSKGKKVKSSTSVRKVHKSDLNGKHIQLKKCQVVLTKLQDPAQSGAQSEVLHKVGTSKTVKKISKGQSKNGDKVDIQQEQPESSSIENLLSQIFPSADETIQDEAGGTSPGCSEDDSCPMIESDTPRQVLVHNGQERLQIKSQEQSEVYTCTLCAKVYESNASLLRHKRLKHKELPYKCAICCKAFRSRAKCNIHRKTKHKEVQSQGGQTHAISDTPNKPSTGNNYTTSFEASASVSQKPRQEENSPSKAVIERGETVKSSQSSNAEAHLTPFKSLPYKCVICGKAFSSKAQCNIHRNTKHKGVDSQESPTQAKSDTRRKNKAPNCSTSSEANATISQKARQKDISLSKTSRVQGETNVEKGQSSNKEDHQTPSKSVPYKCAICGKSFSSKAQCNIHHNTKHKGVESRDSPTQAKSDTPNKCKALQCSTNASESKRPNVKHNRPSKTNRVEGETVKKSQASNTDHQTPSKSLPYKCTICSKAFDSRAKCNIHRNTKHKGVEAPNTPTPAKSDSTSKRIAHNCSTSSKPHGTETKRPRLEDNSSPKTITVEKKSQSPNTLPYKCAICGKAFGSMAQCNIHRNTKHKGVESQGDPTHAKSDTPSKRKALECSTNSSTAKRAKMKNNQPSKTITAGGAAIKISQASNTEDHQSLSTSVTSSNHQIKHYKVDSQTSTSKSQKTMSDTQSPSTDTAISKIQSNSKASDNVTKTGFECHKCNKSFTHEFQYEKHRPCMHERIKCPSCDKTFAFKESFDKHYKSVHLASPGCSTQNAQTPPDSFSSGSNKQQGQVESGTSASVPKNPRLENNSPKVTTQGNPIIRYAESLDPLGKKSFVCKTCHKSFQYDFQYEKHRPCMHKRLECPSCDKTFALKETRDSHYKAVHNEELPYKCEKCKKEFCYEQEFQKHQQNCEKRASSSNTVNTNVPESSNINNKPSSSDKNITIHSARSEKAQCSTTGENSAKRAEDENSQKKREDNATCRKIVQKSDKRTYKVNPSKNVNKSHGEPSNTADFQLKNCQIVLNRLQNIDPSEGVSIGMVQFSQDGQNTVKQADSDGKGSKAVQKSSIMATKETKVGTIKKGSSTEPESKEFICELCDGPFSTKLELLTHDCLILKEYPHCPICEKKFTDIDRHYRAVHLGYRPFRCDMCDVAYSDKRILLKHQQKVHKGSSKQKKPAAAGSSAQLGNSERRKDHDEKSECSTVSAQNVTEVPSNVKDASLDEQTNEKSEEKMPHKCPICLRGFRLRFLVMRHFESAHVQQPSSSPEDVQAEYELEEVNIEETVPGRTNPRRSSTSSSTENNTPRKEPRLDDGNRDSGGDASESGFRKKRVSHEGQGRPQTHTCPICEKTFANKANCKRHQQNVHLKFMSTENQKYDELQDDHEDLTDNNQQISPNKTSEQLKASTDTFREERSIEKEKDRSEIDECEKPQQENTSSDDAAASDTNPDQNSEDDNDDAGIKELGLKLKLYICKICKLTFKDLESLSHHQLRHLSGEDDAEIMNTEKSTERWSDPIKTKSHYDRPNKEPIIHFTLTDGYEDVITASEKLVKPSTSAKEGPSSTSKQMAVQTESSIDSFEASDVQDPMVSSGVGTANVPLPHDDGHCVVSSSVSDTSMDIDNDGLLPADAPPQADSTPQGDAPRDVDSIAREDGTAQADNIQAAEHTPLTGSGTQLADGITLAGSMPPGAATSQTISMPPSVSTQCLNVASHSDGAQKGTTPTVGFIYECNLCKEKFECSLTLIAHIRGHMGEESTHL